MNTDISDTVTDLLPHKVYDRTLQLLTDEFVNTLHFQTPRQAIENMLVILEECLFLNMARVLLPDNSGKYLRIRYAHGLPTEKRFVTYQLNEGITGFVFTTGQSIYIDDLDTNNMYLGRLINPLDLPYSKPAFTGVPIKSLGDEVIGVLCVNHGYRNQTEINSTINLLEKTAQMISQLLTDVSGR